MKTKSIFTTGQVAKIMHVAPRTVSKLIDSGEIEGYRLPGSDDRRVPRLNLVRFLRRHGMTMEGMDSDYKAVLLVGFAPTVADAMTPLLADWDVRTAATPFYAGVIMARANAAVAVFNAAALGGAAVQEAGEAAAVFGAAVAVQLGDDNDAKPWASRGWTALAADAGPGDVAAAIRKAVRW